MTVKQINFDEINTMDTILLNHWPYKPIQVWNKNKYLVTLAVFYPTTAYRILDKETFNKCKYHKQFK